MFKLSGSVALRATLHPFSFAGRLSATDCAPTQGGYVVRQLMKDICEHLCDLLSTYLPRVVRNKVQEALEHCSKASGGDGEGGEKCGEEDAKHGRGEHSSQKFTSIGVQGEEEEGEAPGGWKGKLFGTERRSSFAYLLSAKVYIHKTHTGKSYDMPENVKETVSPHTNVGERRNSLYQECSHYIWTVFNVINLESYVSFNFFLCGYGRR